MHEHHHNHIPDAHHGHGCGAGHGHGHGCHDHHGGLPIPILPWPQFLMGQPPVVPKFYWDAVSDEQRIHYISCLLDKLTNYCDILRCQINTNTKDIAELKELFDTLSDLREKFAQILQDFEDFKDDVNDRLDAMQEYIDSYFKNLEDRMIELINSLIESSILFLKIYSDNGDLAVKAWVSEQLVELWQEIENLQRIKNHIFAPTRGYNWLISPAVNEIYEFLRYFGFTARGFQVQGMTAQQYDNLGTTAREYDTGALMFQTRREWKGAYSPITGKWSGIQQLVNELAALHGGAWNAGGYDEREYSAEQYDRFNWTALYASFINYAGNSRVGKLETDVSQIIGQLNEGEVVGANFDGLTADKMDSLGIIELVIN